MKNIIYILIATFVFAGCKQDPETCECTPQNIVEVKFQLQKDGQDIDIQEEFNADSLGMVVQKMRFYVSHMSIHNSSNYDVKLKDVSIVDLEEPSLTTFQYLADEGSYDAIKFGVGLDATQNGQDPATFPLEHPLSTFYNMYWGWAAMYKFMEFQGKANPSGVIGNPNEVAFSYHPGANDFYRTYSFPVSFNVTSAKPTIIIKIDYDTIFNGSAGSVDVLTENQSHTTPADYTIAERIIFNFGEALSAESL
jgi:hypothetical protein